MQVWRAVDVTDDAVERELAAVADSQPGVHEDAHDEPAAWILEPGEVVGVFQLGHDGFGQRPRLALLQPWVVLAVEIDVGVQPGFPAVLAGGSQQAGDRADIASARLRRRVSSREMRQMGLDHFAGHCVRPALQRGERLRE
jgi:hypothetical protein